MFIGWAGELPRSKAQLAIVDDHGTLIGSCGVRVVSADEKQGTFGCELGTAHWGKGYALEAATAIIQYGLSNFALHRIYAETNSENVAAIALAQRLGFRVEGELRENRWFRGRWWNTTILSVLVTEWEQKSVSY